MIESRKGQSGRWRLTYQFSVALAHLSTFVSKPSTKGTKSFNATSTAMIRQQLQNVERSERLKLPYYHTIEKQTSQGWKLHDEDEGFFIVAPGG